MIWNQRFLFLHIPKTAGKSLTKFFVGSWERPIHGIVSRGQFRELADCDQTGLHLIEGSGHEDMTAARSLLLTQNLHIEKLDTIIVCIRNPYDLMVSNYFFMRESYARNRLDRFAIAVENSFEDFCIKTAMASPRDWMVLDGNEPANLRILRFETLDQDLVALCREFGCRVADLPHLNKGNRGHYRSYLTPICEQRIYEQYHYLFDRGFYQRETM